MIVYIVNYRGTIYGVYDSSEKAYAYAKRKFGENALMCLDVKVLIENVL